MKFLQYSVPCVYCSKEEPGPPVFNQRRLVRMPPRSKGLTLEMVISMGSFLYIYIYKFIYLFIFGCVGSSLRHMDFLQLRWAGATLRCGAWASHCSASLVAEHGLQVRRLQQLWHTSSVVVAHGLWSAGSVVVTHRLSCSAACGNFPDQGSNPCPMHWQVDS